MHVASRLHNERGVRRLAVLARVAPITLIGALATGCFYTGDLNDRPSAEIVRLTEGLPMRGDTVTFRAVVVDPGDQVRTTWAVEGCRHGADADVCDRVLDITSPEVLTIDVVVPDNVGAGAARGPTEWLRVHLDVVDSHGAIARPSQEAIVDVGNAAPMLDVQRRGRELAGEFPEDAPIFVAARATDPEGDPVTITCEPIAPRGSVPGDWSWIQLADPPSGGHEWRLVPDVPGAWSVHCTATDSLAETTADTAITVAPDRPPCLGALDPTPPPAGAAIVLDAPRRFAVLVVDDDLDVYPAPAPDDPFLGAARMRWSIRPVGAAAFTPVDDVAAIELDPRRFAPGDRLDVRVELDDRRGRGVGCDVDAPTCSLTLDACLQRQTWRVEVR